MNWPTFFKSDQYNDALDELDKTLIASLIDARDDMTLGKYMRTYLLEAKSTAEDAEPRTADDFADEAVDRRLQDELEQESER